MMIISFFKNTRGWTRIQHFASLFARVAVAVLLSLREMDGLILMKRYNEFKREKLLKLGR